MDTFLLLKRIKRNVWAFLPVKEQPKPNAYNSLCVLIWILFLFLQKKTPDAEKVVEEDNSTPMSEVTSRLDGADENERAEAEEENDGTDNDDENERMETKDEWIKG